MNAAQAVAGRAGKRFSTRPAGKDKVRATSAGTAESSPIWVLLAPLRAA